MPTITKSKGMKLVDETNYFIYEIEIQIENKNAIKKKEIQFMRFTQLGLRPRLCVTFLISIIN